MALRIWVVEDKTSTSRLGNLVETMAQETEEPVLILGDGPYYPGLTDLIQQQRPDLLVLHAPSWPRNQKLTHVLAGGMGLIVAGGPEYWDRFQDLAERFPVWLVSPTPRVMELRLAVLGTRAACRRYLCWKSQVSQLQQRLNDRIVIERAKGILMCHRGLVEDDAYNRLRVLARQQRRPLRDVAHAIVDTCSLLLPEVNGCKNGKGPEGQDADSFSLPASLIKSSAKEDKVLAEAEDKRENIAKH